MYLRTMTDYKNCNGSVPLNCKCKSALKHWENNTNNNAKDCSVYGCTNRATVGGHVIKCHGNAFKNQYIIPLCSTHNNTNFKDCFRINTHIDPIPVGSTPKCKN